MTATITIREAAQLLGISASGAYTAIRANFPTKVIQIGGRYVVPTAHFSSFGLDELPDLRGVRRSA